MDDGVLVHPFIPAPLSGLQQQGIAEETGVKIVIALNQTKERFRRY